MGLALKPKTGWSSLVLIACLMLTVAWSIALAQPGPAIGALSWVVLGGVAAGAVLGGLAWLPAGTAHLGSMAIGALWTAFLVGGRLESFESVPAADLAGLGAIDRMATVRRWYLAYIDHHPRVSEALPTLSPGPADPHDLTYLFFLVTMALLIWLLAYICTWFIVRYLSWWGAVLPSGFALIFNLSNSSGHTSHGWYLTFFMLCALLLAGQVFVALQSEAWRARHIGFSLDLRYAILRDAVLLALLCLGMAALMPTELEPGTIQRAARQVVRNPQKAFNRTLRTWFPSLVYSGRGEGNSFGQSLDLGGSINLGTSSVFEVEVDAGAPVPRYFRQAVYDQYDGRRWQRNPDETQRGVENVAWAVPGESRRAVTQTIQTLMPQTRQLYAAPQPIQFDLVTDAEIGAADVLTIESEKDLALGSVYTAVSSLSAAEPDTLRRVDDGADPRYLQLPERMPERIRTLARQWVADARATNRYDMASALETRLREHIAYNEQISPPPSGRDRVDWVLFDTQEGYCDYYASSFIVMARSLGIPARLATGYALGQQVGPSRFRQSAANAHAWPEVYFGEHGWVEFEPTGGGGHNLIARPSEDGELPGQAAAAPEAARDANPQRPEDAEEGTGAEEDKLAAQQDAAEAAAAQAAGGFRLPWKALGALAGVVALAWSAAWFGWSRRFRDLSPAAGAFARLSQLAAWLGVGRRAADTPHEFGRRLGGMIPQPQAEISTIVDRYVEERFGRRPAQGGAASQLAVAWRSVRAALIRAGGPLALRRFRRRGNP